MSTVFDRASADEENAIAVLDSTLQEAIAHLLLQSATVNDLNSLAEDALQLLCEVTNSELGFIGVIDCQVQETPSAPPPFKLLAVSDAQNWDAMLKLLQRDDFHTHSTTLIGRTLVEQEAQQWCAERDAPLQHLPKGHAAMRAFLSVPLTVANRLVGIVCLARAPDAPRSYGPHAVQRLLPYMHALASVLASQVKLCARAELEERWLESQRHEMAQNVDRAKDMFLANMSHEIRTPLNGIIGMTKILRGTALSDEQQDYLDTVEQCGVQLLGIVNDVLDYSKIAAGQLRLYEEPQSVRQCLEDAYEMVHARARERNLDVSFSIEPNVPECVRVDGKRLRQVLINLLGNAVKFTERGEVVTTVTAMRRSRETPTDAEDSEGSDLYELSFAVSDTGIGIAAKDLRSIFDSFSQVDSDLARASSGTGLGLTISRKLVELMGGQLRAESTPRHGSTFTFTVLCEEHVDLEQLQSVASQHFQGKRALIVDDNATNRLVLFNLTLGWCMEPSLCSSAEEAMMYVRSGREFDVAFIDVRMPPQGKRSRRPSSEFSANERGVQLALRMREAGASYPLVALSSLGEHFEAPAELFAAKLAKPVKEQRLFKVCAHVLNQLPVHMPLQPSSPSIVVAPRALRILVAEDNLTNQKVIAGMLKTLGYTDVVMTSNGIEAMEAVETQEPFDVLLLDIRMPLMDGFQVARKITNSIAPALRPIIIAVTASVLDQDREKCSSYGMSAFLGKPIVMAELETMLQVIGEQKQQ